jgi:tripartite ATP-independent transporter DctP family solute receptor
MRYKLSSIARAAVVLGLLAGASSAGAEEIRSHTFRFALQPAKDSAQVQGAEHFADVVRDKSGGKMIVKVFEGGQLGTDTSSLTAMQVGTIDFSLMGTGNLTGYDKGYMVFDIPFLFDTNEEVDAVSDGPIGEKLKERVVPKGLRILSYAELGFRHIHNSKRPVKTLEDLKGLKLRVIPWPMYVDFINATGANALPLAFTELYTALEQKAVDGATNPFDNISATKFYEINKYLSLSRHMYTMMAFIMSNKTWLKLNPAEQAVIMAAAKEGSVYERKMARQKAEKDFEFLKTKMEVNQIPPAEVAKLREIAKPVVAKFAKDIGPDLVKSVNDQLAAMRAKAK